jgi:two-component sensor histidine kinase
MSDDELLQRVEALERDNARLRRLLDGHGSTASLRHQTRNTLAMVRDVVRRSAETSDSVEDYAAHLEGRLDAVFRIQNTIANRPLDGVSLHTLLGDELMVHMVSRRERLSISGPDILLQPAAASALALAFHELNTNAIKFGALSVPEGRLAVTWSVEPDGADGQPWLTLDWVESGSSVKTSPARRGFGSEVIEHAVPYQLSGRGSLDVKPTGLRCTLHLPLTPSLGSLHVMPDVDVLADEPSLP